MKKGYWLMSPEYRA
ncbi:hypothetical protein FZP57_04545 [Methanothermobacter sp. THM-1]|nr:hypothetical protein FZP57_04545 [Methanothermobacter sp. THM-1]